jgi:hypothetical protein
MTRAIPILVVVLAPLACGPSNASPPPKYSGTTPTSSASSAADETDRALTQSECESLGQWMLAACEKQGNTHSSQLEGWCSNVTHHVTGDGTWVADDCLPHLRRMDAECIKSTDSVKNMMDCERDVAH